MTIAPLRQIWLVARWEFVHAVRRTGFIIALVSLPMLHLGLASLIGLSTRSVIADNDAPAAIALVDPSGAITARAAGELGDRAHIERTVESARALLRERRIACFAVIGTDYLETGRIEIHAREEGGLLRFGARLDHRARVARAIRQAMLNDRLPDTIRARVVEPDARVAFFTVKTDGRSLPEADNAILAAFAGPLGVSLLLGIGIFVSGGTLQESMSSERENRMLEVLLSSVPAESLVTGKVIGLSAAGFLQLAFYVLVLAATAGSGIVLLDLSVRFVIAAAACFATGYVLFSVLMGVTGAIARTGHESMQMASVWMLAAASPLMLVHWITTDGGLGTARWLSWFPLTAPVTVLLRLGNGTIGPIEIVSALAFTWIFSAIALAAGARLFRAVVLGRSG